MLFKGTVIELVENNAKVKFMYEEPGGGGCWGGGGSLNGGVERIAVCDNSLGAKLNDTVAIEVTNPIENLEFLTFVISALAGGIVFYLLYAFAFSKSNTELSLAISCLVLFVLKYYLSKKVVSKKLEGIKEHEHNKVVRIIDNEHKHHS